EHPTIGSIHLTVDPAQPTDPNTPSAITLAGYGPIHPDLIANFPVTRLLRTRTGDQTSRPDGHDRRRPTASQTRQVQTSHPTCIAPGCRMPSVDCDLDHTIPYAETQWTQASQLAPLCRHDHRIRHHTGWNYKINTDGTITWTSPIGTAYTTSGRDP
ncbi:MAG: HNH endonuclease signature motif containing protein, partial [Acidimicrobiia bacterium]|nr:HNH endonuclease signature motif containing protein [Acidimicrobiia bacterium]